MTDKEEITCNQLIAAGGWIRRAMNKRRVYLLFQAEHAMQEAVNIIDNAIADLRDEPDGRHDQEL